MEQDLITVVTDGAMRALVLHASAKGVDPVKHLPALREIAKVEYFELLDTLKDALHMDEAMIKHTINVYCNSWAVKALNPICRFCTMPLPKGSHFGAVHKDCLTSKIAEIRQVGGEEAEGHIDGLQSQWEDAV